MGVEYGYHKDNDDDLVNLLNYMSHAFMGFQRHAFLGFIPITGGAFGFGVDINDKNYTACHVFRAPEWFDDNAPDEGNVRKNKPWILMFYGSDNSSYCARFRTEQDAIDYFNKIEVFNKQVYNRCFGYNS